MRFLVIFIFIPLFSFGQKEDHISEAKRDIYIIFMEGLIKTQNMEVFFYPERSMYGGALYGYYLGDQLRVIKAKNDVSFYSDEHTIYFNALGDPIKVIFEKHFPLEEEFSKKYGDDDPIDWSKMEHADTTWTYYINDDYTLISAEGAKPKKSKDKRLIEDRLIYVDSMVAELGRWKVRQWYKSDSIKGDFSFTEKWDYPLGVYVNKWGQVSCDGFCPEGAWGMKVDSRIPEDSLEKFYSLVDTTHQHHSLKSEFEQYELFDSDYLDFKKVGGKIIGSSRCDAGNHSSLHIEIDGSSFTAWVEFVSMTPIDPQRFELGGGILILDEELLEKGIVKGEFDFEFENTLDPTIPLSWKGIFYNNLEE